MKITITTIGSRGDIQPYVALGIGLRRAGYDVNIATHAMFEEFVRRHDLGFSLIRTNPKELLESELGQEWLRSGSNPIKFFRIAVEFARGFLKELSADIQRVCIGSDMIITAILTNIFSFSMSESLKIPAMAAYLQPMHPTRNFPAWHSPIQHDMGNFLNLTSHYLFPAATWFPVATFVNRWRTEKLGLPPYDFRKIIKMGEHKTLYGFSRHIIPNLNDWQEHIHVTGYWFLNEESNWTPSSDLLKFLESGAPPIYFGFGSMKSGDPKQFTRRILQALKQTGQRGILATGWGGIHSEDLPTENVFPIDYVPHSWLFPRMAGLVHHCGAGTTGAGLRAGVPTIPIPLFADQPFWAKRMYDLGVATSSIPYRKLTSQKLATAIRQLLSDDQLNENADKLGRKIREENGVMTAVEAIKRMECESKR